MENTFHYPGMIPKHLMNYQILFQIRNLKLLFPFPEDKIHFLKLIIAEILYSVVNKRSDSVFINTDTTGKHLITGFLSDIDTERCDLNYLLIKGQKDNILINTGSYRQIYHYSDLIIFFRIPNINPDDFEAKKVIIIETLRDIYQQSSEYDNYNKLTEQGYLKVNFKSVPKKNETCKNYFIQYIQNQQLHNLISLFNERSLLPNLDTTLIFNNFISSFFSNCLPAQWLSGCDTDIQYKHLLNQLSILHNRNEQIITLLDKINKNYSSHNEKYSLLCDFFNLSDCENSKIGLVFPCKDYCDALIYNNKGYGDTFILKKDHIVFSIQDLYLSSH
jgi:hypothetical protein